MFFKVASLPYRNFPHSPTGDHHSSYLSMLALACFEKNFKKNNHPELCVARHKQIKSPHPLPPSIMSRVTESMDF